MKFQVCRSFTWEASHQLNLAAGHPCARMHGHSYKAEVIFESEILDNGFVIDASIVKGMREQLDHRCMNDVIQDNPTAENIALFILSVMNKILLQFDCHQEVHVVSVKVHETADMWAMVINEARKE